MAFSCSSLRVLVFAAIGWWEVLAVSAQPKMETSMVEESAGVVIVGATPGGIAAALAAAESGAEVILVEEQRVVGGIIAGGLTTADIGNNKAVGGAFNDFRRGVREYYAANYGENSDQYEDCRAGRQVEPHVAEIVFRRMLHEHHRLKVYTGQGLESVGLAGQTVSHIVIRDLTGSDGARKLTARVFIDATYEGDLAAPAGVKYRVGREGRTEYGESLAGRIYTRLFTREILPGSTGEADDGIQAYCFRIHVTTVPENRVPFERPAGYRRDDYQYLLADLKAGRVSKIAEIFQFQKAPNGKFELNSNHRDPVKGGPCESFDLAEENWRWPEADRAERKRVFARYWTYQEGMLWFLQTDPEVPEALRQETSTYGLCRDEFVNTNFRPHHLYVRQGRRIIGEYLFTQREEDPDPATKMPRLHRDSIAIATYPWDSHAVSKYDPQYPEAREGYYVVKHPPLQVPYGVIVPKEVDGLLVPVACSATHVGYQTIRMEPVFMALGQAAGIAAAQSIQEKKPVRAIAVSRLQQEITRRRGVISYFEDVPPTHAAAKAIQWLGPRGFAVDFNAKPDQSLTENEGAAMLARIMESEGREWGRPIGNDRLLTVETLRTWLRNAGLRRVRTSSSQAPGDLLTRGTAAQMIADSLMAAESP